MERERLLAWNVELQYAHHALERALNEARISIATVAPLDSLSNDLTLHCRGFCSALDDHHRSEDAALFPRLLADAPELRDAIAVLMQDHRTLASLLSEFEELLIGSDIANDVARDGLDAQLDRIEAVMKKHFSDEERHLHTMLRTLTADATEKEALLGSPPP